MNISRVLLPTLLICVGCVSQPAPKPPRTQLEIRQNQTREYLTADTKMVMKALLNTLQDDGFIVKNAVTELGLITGTKELDVEQVSGYPGGFSTTFGFGSGRRSNSGLGFGLGYPWGVNDNAITSKNSIIEVSANVTEFRSETRVRVNFQEKIVDNRGGTLEVRQIDDPEYYQDFFSKVDKGIFLQRERL